MSRGLGHFPYDGDVGGNGSAGNAGRSLGQRIMRAQNAARAIVGFIFDIGRQVNEFGSTAPVAADAPGDTKKPQRQGKHRADIDYSQLRESVAIGQLLPVNTRCRQIAGLLVEV
jgi:hypothetical protein